MNKLRTILTIKALLLCFILYGQGNSQFSHGLSIRVPKIISLNIEPNGAAVTLNALAPIEAGDPLDLSDTDNSLWLNYSTIAGNGPNSKRSVLVSADGTLPVGLLVRVQALPIKSNGNGQPGTPGDIVTFTDVNTNYTLINNIGTSYTGRGQNFGHQLIYSLARTDASYGLLNFDSDYSMVVTYTLSEN